MLKLGTDRRHRAAAHAEDLSASRDHAATRLLNRKQQGIGVVVKFKDFSAAGLDGRAARLNSVVPQSIERSGRSPVDRGDDAETMANLRRNC